MKKHSCGGTIKLYRQINASGSVVIVERCERCRKNPNKGQPFISKKGIDNIENLPLFEDYREHAEPCAVCGKRETEYHHYSPRHIFGIASDKWATAWLCREHHDEWHKKTRTGSYWRQK